MNSPNVLWAALNQAINALATIEGRLQEAQDDQQRAAVAELRRVIAQGRSALTAVDERCEGRYPVPQTSPPRDEPFEVTYRCARPKGHDGPHGP